MTIQVLSNKDKARTRINVFHDSSSNWINLIKELIGNSLDVFDKDYLNYIYIKLHSNTKIEYKDSGSGIPVEGIASDGRPNYQAIFETDFAGSKYGSVMQTVGQNGIFLWSLAMTCSDITFEIARPNGKIYSISYHKGERVGDLKVIGTSDETYTKIIFEPDNEVWENPNYTFEEISLIAQGQASLANVEITLEEVNRGIKEVYRYENGIYDYFEEKTNNKTFVTDNIVLVKNTKQMVEKLKQEDDISINLIFSYSNDSNDDFKKDFLNTADLIRYGTINEGIIDGIRVSVNKWLKDNNKYNKSEKQINKDDVEIGLNYVCDVKSFLVEFVSQSKQRTDLPHYKISLKNNVDEFLSIYFVENPLQAEKLCGQVLINKRVREKSEVNRQELRKKLTAQTNKGLSVKIEGLKDCDMRHSELEERILILDEGLSANSTIIEAFDNRYMGCYGLKGRFINSLKSSVKDVLNNIPAYGIIQALGCGIEIPYEERKQFKDIQTFDQEKLRYGKVGILCDADAFGKGISLSLITFFKRYFPTLLKDGRIYLVASPRYEIRNKKHESFYAYNEKQKEDLIKELGNSFYDISIRKGLGEFNKEEFWEYVLSPEARKSTFTKVLYEGDESEIDRYFDMLMGDDIISRKSFIKENIVNLNLDELE